MSITLPFGEDLLILCTLLLLVASTVMLSKPKRPHRVRRSGAVRRASVQRTMQPLLASSAAACTAGALLLAQNGRDQPAVLSIAVLSAGICLAGLFLLRHGGRVAPAATQAAGPGAAGMLARLSALIASPSQARVSRLVHRLALQAGADPGDADELQAASMLHEIGRIGLPHALLSKGGVLDETERRLMDRQPVIGARILGGGQTRLHDRAAELALCHQERWDGSGYPRRLAGLHIPLSARIVAIATAFDALLAGRDDAPSLPIEQVLLQMKRDAGRLLDPDLVRIFLDDVPAMLGARNHGLRAGSPACADTAANGPAPGTVLSDAAPALPAFNGSSTFA